MHKFSGTSLVLRNLLCTLSCVSQRDVSLYTRSIITRVCFAAVRLSNDAAGYSTQTYEPDVDRSQTYVKQPYNSNLSSPDYHDYEGRKWRERFHLK